MTTTLQPVRNYILQAFIVTKFILVGCLHLQFSLLKNSFIASDKHWAIKNIWLQ